MNGGEIEVRPIANALGAEIHGIDLSRELDDATFTAVRQALHDHLVIFFRDQRSHHTNIWPLGAASVRLRPMPMPRVWRVIRRFSRHQGS